jgi:alkyl hydroperoxide reductase subunit AhpC
MCPARVRNFKSQQYALHQLIVEVLSYSVDKINPDRREWLYNSKNKKFIVHYVLVFQLV